MILQPCLGVRKAVDSDAGLDVSLLFPQKHEERSLPVRSGDWLTLTIRMRPLVATRCLLLAR
jgi:hypothetical protein